MQELSETRSEAVHQGCGRAARQGSFLEGSNGSQGPRWWWELCPEILTQKEVTGRFSHINSKQSGSAAERLVQRSWGEERKEEQCIMGNGFCPRGHSVWWGTLPSWLWVHTAGLQGPRPSSMWL